VGDAAALARQILEVAGQHRELGAAARRYVLEAGYAWDQTLERLLAIYADALDLHPAARARPEHREEESWDGARP
jgi:alpha-1,6-mannosyltransferase